MSFVKKGAAKTAELGTRPGLSGQTLVSTGLADLDKLVGGGLPLGTVTLLLEDNYTQHHATLLKYFLAEGAANKQALHWSAGCARHTSNARVLPQQVQHVLKDDVRDKQQENEEVQLRIAWQYRRYIKSKKKAAASISGRGTGGSQSSRKAKSGSAALGGVRDWSHSFDLTKSTPVSELLNTRTECPEFHGSDATKALTDNIRIFVQSLTQPSTDPPASHPQASQAPSTCRTAQRIAPDPPSLSALSIAEITQSTNPAALQTDESMLSGNSGRYRHSGGQAMSQSSGQPFPERLKSSDATQSSNESQQSLPQGAPSPGSTAPSPNAAIKGVAMHPSTSATDRQQSVGRVVVGSLGGLQWRLEGAEKDVERQLYTAVFQLKAMIRESRCAAMVSFPAGLYSSSLTARLAHLCDTVIGLEAVKDDSDIVRLIPEPASCCGLLHLQKLPSLNALGPPIPDITLFIIRHKRRRLAVQAVQIDPDAEAGETDSKSAAAALCGGPPKADKPFDF